MNPSEAPGLFAPLLPFRSLADAAGVFLDIDGVLAAIRPRPEDASVPGETLFLLGSLTDRYRVVAAVSGRSLDDAAVLVPVPGLIVVGNHGMEAAGPGWREEWTDGEVRRQVEAAAQELRLDAELRDAGVELELKGLSLSLHYRRAPDEDEAAGLSLRLGGQVAARHGLVVLPGRAVVDLRPPGPNKGVALRRLIERHSLAAAAYLGDDRTDLDAFRMLAGLRKDGLVTASIAVVSEEAPPELREEADLAVAFAEVPRLFEFLLET